jgi:hypothetical protein
MQNFGYLLCDAFEDVRYVMASVKGGVQDISLP